MSLSTRSDRAVRCRIRPFAFSDLDAVLQVEESSFAFPWSREMFVDELGREGISKCFVAEILPDAYPSNTVRSTSGENIVAGYIMSWLVADELYINSLAVSPVYRRLGLAAGLIEQTLDEARENGANWCQLEVRSTNAAAQALYRKFGFREIGVRRGYYQDGEDAVLMGKELST